MKVTYNDIVEYMGLIKLNYPKAFIFEGTEEKVRASKKKLIDCWLRILSPYPKEICDMGVTNAIKNIEYGAYPQINTIIKEIKKVIQGFKKTPDELWQEFIKIRYQAIRYDDEIVSCFKCNDDKLYKETRIKAGKLFKEMSPELQRYFVNWYGLVALAKANDDNLLFEKRHFIKAIREQEEKYSTRQENPEFGVIANKNQLKLGEINNV